MLNLKIFTIMTKMRLFRGVAAILTITWFISGCTGFAQNTKDGKKKKTKSEYLHLKIEKDEDGKVVKVDTMFSSGKFSDKHMKSFSFHVPGFNDDDFNGKENFDFDFDFDIDIDDGDDVSDKMENIHMEGFDSAFYMNIMNKIHIRCNGKEGEECVKIFTDDGQDESWLDSIFGKCHGLDKEGGCNAVCISIDDNGIQISDDKSGGKKIRKKCIIMSKVKIDDASKEEKEAAGYGNGAKTKELDIDELTFSPNPGKGKFDLGFELVKKGDVEIRITDLNGKELFKESLKNFKGEYKKQIDISDNSKGIYLLNIRQDNRQLCKKIVIN